MSFKNNRFYEADGGVENGVAHGKLVIKKSGMVAILAICWATIAIVAASRR